MFIETEPTPNPATLKFLPGRTITGGAAVDFADAIHAERSPLALALFALPGVAGVFLGSDFITVTKTADTGWDELRGRVLVALLGFFNSDQPVLSQAITDDHDQDAGEDDEIVQQIKDLLDTRVRPAVAQDGGDITFHGFQDGIVYLHMKGACSGCPSATATLRSGIENLLRHYVPEVVEVRPVR